MFYQITGKLVHAEQNLAVLETGGIAFACKVSQGTLGRIQGGRGRETVTLYTYLHVREELLELYGFETRVEQRCFLMLIGISGIGPKVGLGILSVLSPEEVAAAAARGDVKGFTKVSGVGPKMAQRIVLELKDKVKGLGIPQGADGPLPAGPPMGQPSASAKSEQAMAALMSLGYSQQEAAPIVGRLDPSLSLEEMIRLALKSFS